MSRCVENEDDDFPSASGPSAVSGRPYNPRIFDRFLTDTSLQLRARGAKIRGHARTLLERVMLHPSDGHSSMHSHRHTVFSEVGFGDRERFFVIYGFKCGLPGMIVSNYSLCRTTKFARCRANPPSNDVSQLRQQNDKFRVRGCNDS